MRILAISSAGNVCLAAMVQDGAVLAGFRLEAARGLPDALALGVAGVLDKAAPPDLVAVVVGPGSFTGLRAGIAVAHGVAIGAGIAVVGVTLAEALLQTLAAGTGTLDGREVWIATPARTGRVFIGRGNALDSFAEAALPQASGRVAVAGEAAARVAATLASRGVDTMLTGARLADPVAVAAVGEARASGRLPALDAVPLYVDAAEARLPAGGLRPAPA